MPNGALLWTDAARHLGALVGLEPARVLIVAEREARARLPWAFQAAGYEVRTSEPSDLLESLDRECPELLVVDSGALGQLWSQALHTEIRQRAGELPIILLADSPNEQGLGAVYVFKRESSASDLARAAQHLVQPF